MSTTLYTTPYGAITITAPLGQVAVSGIAPTTTYSTGTTLFLTPYVSAYYDTTLPISTINASGLTPFINTGTGTVLYLTPATETAYIITPPIGVINITAIQPLVSVVTYEWYDVTITVNGSIEEALAIMLGASF